VNRLHTTRPMQPSAPLGRTQKGSRGIGGSRVADELTEKRKTKLPESLGFRDSVSSVHNSRTMMFAELSLAFGYVSASAGADEYFSAIIEQNILGKPTQTTRKRTARLLAKLYAFDQARPVFRLLRHFWAVDAAARPMLACLAAAARDPLFRDTASFVVAIPVGATLDSKQVAKYLGEKYSGRFSSATLTSTSQNLASSWTQAGYVQGKINKKRTRPVANPVLVTYALLLGYLCGVRGKMLLDTIWTRMLDRTSAEIADFAVDASKQGWMNYKAVGPVVEITFPGLLTPKEEKASHESH
jgi:alkylated DNA nucleotide flippase Atl1